MQQCSLLHECARTFYNFYHLTIVCVYIMAVNMAVH